MQALINIILALLKPTLGYQKRIPPATPDWTQTEIAPDTNWHTHDCSAIVPEGTKAILLRLNARASASGRKIIISTEDEIQWHSMAQLIVIYANRDQTMDKIVALTPARTFKTISSTTSWTYIQLTIAGYWLQAQNFESFVNRGDPAVDDFTEGDFTADAAWHTLDLSGIIPLNTKAIVMRCRVRSGSTAKSLRFRTHGNVNAINISQCEAVTSGLSYYYDVTVPTNGLQSIDYFDNITLVPIIRVTVKGWSF